MNRVIDFSLALFGLLLLAPFLGMVAVWITVDSPGGAFFSQVRVGQNGKEFWLWKMRSMRRMKGFKSLVTQGNADPRITASGRFVRKTKFDELPQLWNVLKGEMAIVGPRPEVPHYVATYSQEQLRVLLALPGLTDPASLMGMDEGERIDAAVARGEDGEEYYLREIMPTKVRAQLDYLEKRTLGSDLHVMWETIGKITGARS